jgi:2-phospho-L-lactate guanylyltransferase
VRRIGVPIKAFGVAKARLAPVLGPDERARLGKAVAEHTLGVAGAVGRVAVVTGDADVASWALGIGREVVPERPGGLDGAAAAFVDSGDGPWAVLHADLPLLAVPDLEAALASADLAGWAIAPSSDGGTSLVAGEGPFPFAYGPGSFQRHFASRPGAAVVVRRGLAVDLDTPSDLAAVRNGPDPFDVP